MATQDMTVTEEDLSGESCASHDVDLGLESSYALRKRIRAERKKVTQEKIKSMKERQRKSESMKRRQPYLHITCSVIAGAAAIYLFYHFCLNSG